MTPKKVKAIRQKLGLTQVQFAKQLNYTQANISKWESGAIKLGPRVESAIGALEHNNDYHSALKALIKGEDYHPVYNFDENKWEQTSPLKGENQ